MRAALCWWRWRVFDDSRARGAATQAMQRPRFSLACDHALQTGRRTHARRFLARWRGMRRGMRRTREGGVCPPTSSRNVDTTPPRERGAWYMSTLVCRGRPSKEI